MAGLIRRGEGLQALSLLTNGITKYYHRRINAKGFSVRKKRKKEVITFKVDPTLAGAMDGIHNRSAFIRSAILAALENVCPLCMGTGVLSPKQRAHWEDFTAHHAVKECDECHELYLVCSNRAG